MFFNNGFIKNGIHIYISIQIDANLCTKSLLRVFPVILFIIL